MERNREREKMLSKSTRVETRVWGTRQGHTWWDEVGKQEGGVAATETMLSAVGRGPEWKAEIGVRESHCPRLRPVPSASLRSPLLARDQSRVKGGNDTTLWVVWGSGSVRAAGNCWRPWHAETPIPVCSISCFAGHSAWVRYHDLCLTLILLTLFVAKGLVIFADVCQLASLLQHNNSNPIMTAWNHWPYWINLGCLYVLSTRSKMQMNLHLIHQFRKVQKLNTWI